MCAFPQHFAVEAILAHYSSVAEGCRRAWRTRTIFFSSFVPNSIRLPFKGSVEFGRSLSRVEVGNGLVEGVLVKWAVSLLLVLLRLFFRRIYRRGGVLLPWYLLGFLEAVLVGGWCWFFGGCAGFLITLPRCIVVVIAASVTVVAFRARARTRTRSGLGSSSFRSPSQRSFFFIISKCDATRSL